MKFRLLTAYLLAIGAQISNNSYATIISSDDINFGSDSVTQDTLSGLEWLDLSFTFGLSYQDIQEQNQDNQKFNSWRYATAREALDLACNAGELKFTPDCPFGYSGGVSGNKIWYQYHFEATSLLDLSNFLLSNDQLGDLSDNSIVGRLDHSKSIGYTLGAIDINYGRSSDHFRSTTEPYKQDTSLRDSVGSFLVRSINTEPVKVPEPHTLILMALGVFSLNLSRIIFKKS